ncbi:probable WRKY transcription factor 30 [Cornus florida]|uniref:probable WRKY transcription factor 30 n=1 Tax=Cornus florida TaxID=4283 RepID=UPI0028985516|nr:probable WRKY transcription factor 30 [Cornus florida]
MENSIDWEQKNLIHHELTQGRELTKQLQTHLNVPSSSQEARELLVLKILKSYDNALSMLKWNGSVAELQPTAGGGGGAIGTSESPRSFSGSPHSEDSDREFRDQDHKDGSRKRKCMPRWTKQVQVCPGTGLEGPLDDGFNWRKYGQKDILGAKYPRGYYRCTHRNVQGCLATKQVQRSDEDPTIFEITYRGRHTCTRGSILPAQPSPENQEPNTPQDHQQQQQQQQQQPVHQPPQNQEILIDFRTGLKVITENLDNQQNSFPSFIFPSTSNIKPENHPAYSPSMLENNLMGNFSCPSFVSPATSGSNYYSVSPAHMNSFVGTGTQNLHTTSECELNEIVSATSATNSPTVGLDFPFGPVEFDPSFTFDNPGFFS